MPVFGSRNTLEFGRKDKVRVFFHVEVGLTDLGSILDKLKSRLGRETVPARPVAPPQNNGRVQLASEKIKGVVSVWERRKLRGKKSVR